MNKTILSEFSDYLNIHKNVSTNTIRSYCRDICMFFEYLEQEGISAINAGQTHITSYIIEMQNTGRADSSIQRSIASIRSLYTFLLITQTVSKNPCVNIRLPKREKNIPSSLTTDEIDKLMCAPDCSTKLGLRDKAMLELIYACGIKVSELISLRVSDIDTELGYLKCVHTNSVRIIPIGKTAINALVMYLDIAREQIAAKDEKALFVNRSGYAMTRQGFWKIVKHYAMKVGIDKEITPHTFRHSFATHLLENGADLSSLQEMLGHKDISSTKSYAKLVHKGIREVYNQTHPRA